MEADRPINRRRQFIDRGYAVFRVDEQPLPVHGDHIDLKRLDALGDGLALIDPIQRPIGIQQVGARPGNGAQADDDEQRRGPDRQLQVGRVVPVRLVAGFLVRLPIFPGEEDDHRHHRDDDDQHQHHGHDQQVALLHRDVAGRRQDNGFTARQHGQERQ
ncbi:hypothetical protein D3C80_1330960 [compost metagenome]